GDISWAMTLEEGLKDFEFIEDLPGAIYILKGNHDYWWSTKNKMETFFTQNGLKSINILHNNSIIVDEKAICGSRGWLFEKGNQHDKKIIVREASRLQLSIDSIKDTSKHKIAFLHYPPIYGNEVSAEIMDVLIKNKITQCYYGHIHSTACNYALNAVYMGIDFKLVSSDFIKFNPILVK
ncbi:MAG: metallophosphoesterase, partial [Oscillospiraceae bacterium]